MKVLSELVQIRMTEVQKEKLTTYAKTKEQTISETVRFATDNDLFELCDVLVQLKSVALSGGMSLQTLLSEMLVELKKTPEQIKQEDFHPSTEQWLSVPVI